MKRKKLSWISNKIKITETSTSSTVSPSLLGENSKLSNDTPPSNLEFIAHYAKISTPLKEEAQNERNTFVVSHESDNALNSKENWRGEGKTDANQRKRKIDTNDKTYRKKFNYLDACADWDFLPNGVAVGILYL